MQRMWWVWKHSIEVTQTQRPIISKILEKPLLDNVLVVCLSITGLPSTMQWLAKTRKPSSFFYSAGSKWTRKTTWERLRRLHLKVEPQTIAYAISSNHNFPFCALWLTVWRDTHSFGCLVWQSGDPEIISAGRGWAQGWERGKDTKIFVLLFLIYREKHTDISAICLKQTQNHSPPQALVDELSLSWIILDF